MADNALAFESLEGVLEWIDEDGTPVTLYTKLADDALRGFNDEMEVMPTEYAPLADYKEAVLDAANGGDGRTFMLIPKPDADDAPMKRFIAADEDEAAAWIESINEKLMGVPQMDEDDALGGNNNAYDGYQQQQQQYDDWQRQQVPTQPSANSAPQSAPTSTRLQASLEVPLKEEGLNRQTSQASAAGSVPPVTAVLPRQASREPSNTIPPRAWDSPVVASSSNALRTMSNTQPHNPPVPAVRTTTYTTHDEYRHGGVPQNRYDQTSEWVQGTTAAPAAAAPPAADRHSSVASSAAGGGWGNPSETGGASSKQQAMPSYGGGMYGQQQQQALNNTQQSVSQSPIHANHNGMGARPNPYGSTGWDTNSNNGGYGPSGSGGFGGGGYGGPNNNSSAAGFGNPAVNNSQLGGYGSNNNGMQPLQQQDPNTANSMLMQHNNNNSILGRKRSGMFVNVPANQQLNRNVAPNVSAMWKEWTDPNGDLYVFHEPTNTLHTRRAGSNVFETLLEGSDPIPEDHLPYHPYFDEMADTVCDLNGKVVRNIQNYGTQRIEGNLAATSPDVYRSDAVTTPRGQFSPSRKSRISALNPPPRQPTAAYEGRRVHHLSIGAGPTGDPSESVITHQVQPLSATGLLWDPKTGKALDPNDPANANPRGIGASTLYKQWEHVRSILMQGRYFKKHAVKSSVYSYRFVFLTGDNAYVVCVPTSEVMLNIHTSAKTFNTVNETVQYFGRDAKAIALNTITRVSLGTDEDSILRRRGNLKPENTFCIVTQTHAFILECNTSKEARYFADAWNFFMHHSKPMNLQAQRTKEMRNPVTHGTRAGLAF